MATEVERLHTLDLVRRVLEEIGHECDGVQYTIDLVPVGAGIFAPAVILRWDPNVHPATQFDPAQAIVIENMATGKPLKDDTLRRVLREKIEHLLSVNKHAHKELYAVDSLSEKEGRTRIRQQLDAEAAILRVGK